MIRHQYLTMKGGWLLVCCLGWLHNPLKVNGFLIRPTDKINGRLGMVGEAILAEAIANSQHGLFSPAVNTNNDPVEKEDDKKNNVLVWNGSGNGDSDGNSVLYGEADRYYVHGMQLDENGQARAAAAAYLEAATLYQCCLGFDPSSSQNPFGHVTSSTEIQSLLASVALRLAHVNQDALGDPKSATRLYKDVCYKMKFPSDTALDGTI